MGCDTSIEPENPLETGPLITDLQVTPQNVVFNSVDDGIRDTTVVINFEVSTENLEPEYPPLLILNDRFTNTLILENEMEISSVDPDRYLLEVSINTRTTLFKEYDSQVIVQNGSGDFNYAQASVSLTGFSLSPPEILEVSNPDSVLRPTSGTDFYPFTAKVTDPEGQETLESVFLRIINPESGEVNNSPFRLYDNGTEGGDQSAGDSLYTITFPVDANSQLQTFDLLYFAIDKGGLVSDTVRTTFSIVE